MITEMQAQHIKSYVESMLVCEGQVINASNRLLDAELKVEMESEVKYLEEILRLYQFNAEALGEQFLIYLDSLVDKSKTKEEGCDHNYVYRETYANCEYYHCSKCQHIMSIKV